MEYKDYVMLHELFGDKNNPKALINPHSSHNAWMTTYDSNTKIIRGNWFDLTNETFKIHSDRAYLSPYTIGKEYAYTEIEFDILLPNIINIEYINSNEFTVNGHKAHPGLEISLKTGKALFYKHAPYPNTDEEKTLATSTLRKHITAYKKRARPIFRLLEGSLTQNDETRDRTKWGNRKYDELDTHQVYEIFRQQKPTPDELNQLVNAGNSASNYTNYIQHTSFEASLNRVIQRRRKDLQSFALLEATNQYKTPTQLNQGVKNGGKN